jgi:hypothetical protein
MKNKKSADKGIRNKEEIQKNPDPRIDQDFEGYPHGTAKKETIKPETKNQKKTADLYNKDGEKKFDEQDSDGSANAFDDK